MSAAVLAPPAAGTGTVLLRAAVFRKWPDPVPGIYAPACTISENVYWFSYSQRSHGP